MKKRLRTVLWDYTQITLGCALLAAGLNLFLVPNVLSSGGVSTLATVLFYLFDVPLSITTLILNALLLALGYRYLGKSAVVKTIVGVVMLSAFLELTRRIPVYTEDVLIATLAGGVLVGVGVGLVIRREASTGGSDFAALVLKRFFPHLSTARLILIIDCIIIALSGVVFRSLTVTMYSLVSMFLYSKVADLILEHGTAAKSVYIMSSQTNEIASLVLRDFSRGVTGIYSRGVYSEQDRMMLLCVVSPKELPRLIRAVRALDKAAFIIITDVREVVGQGFRSLGAYSDGQNK
jgi:uncharacterized membrane-anchored protein YitT (DUF2179 family)